MSDSRLQLSLRPESSPGKWNRQYSATEWPIEVASLQERLLHINSLVETTNDPWDWTNVLRKSLPCFLVLCGITSNLIPCDSLWGPIPVCVSSKSPVLPGLWVIVCTLLPSSLRVLYSAHMFPVPDNDSTTIPQTPQTTKSPRKRHNYGSV